MKAHRTLILALLAGLVLAGNVASVSVTALMLALTIRLYRRYGTLDIDQIVTLARKGDEP